jgi:hypothetical protein
LKDRFWPVAVMICDLSTDLVDANRSFAALSRSSKQSAETINLAFIDWTTCRAYSVPLISVS